MDDPRKDPPFHADRAVLAGWGIDLLLLVIAYFLGGSFLPYFIAFFALALVGRSISPTHFAHHFDAKLIEGTPYRRKESLRKWAIVVVACLLFAQISAQ